MISRWGCLEAEQIGTSDGLDTHIWILQVVLRVNYDHLFLLRLFDQVSRRVVALPTIVKVAACRVPSKAILVGVTICEVVVESGRC